MGSIFVEEVEEEFSTVTKPPTNARMKMNECDSR